MNETGPTLIKRETGGWLALTPDGEDSPRFGVDAPTRAEAEAAYATALARWRAAAERAIGR